MLKWGVVPVNVLDTHTIYSHNFLVNRYIYIYEKGWKERKC